MFVHCLWPDSSRTVPLHWVEVSHLGWGFCPASFLPPWDGEVPLCGNETGKRHMGVFPFAVVLLETDMHFPFRLLAHRFATRRDGRRKTAKQWGLRLLTTFRGVVWLQEKKDLQSNLQLMSAGRHQWWSTGKMIYTVWASGPAVEECFALWNTR